MSSFRKIPGTVIFEVEEMPSSEGDEDEEIITVEVPQYSDEKLSFLADVMNWSLHNCAGPESFFECKWYWDNPVRIPPDNYEEAHYEIYGNAPWRAEHPDSMRDENELLEVLASRLN